MEFNVKRVNAFKPPADKADHYEWDEAMPGFGFRSRSGGAKIWVVKYRVGDKQRKVTLGKVSKVPLVEAQAIAKRMFAKVADAIDPANERSLASASANETFGSAIDGYLTKLEKERSASYYGQNKMYLETHFKPLHGLALTSVTRKLVSDQFKIISKRGPITANRARSALSAFFNWAIREGFEGLENNPAHMTNKNDEQPRNRDFNNRELKAIWHGVPDNEFGDIVKVLMLTMQRRTEIGGLPTKEFNRAERQIEIDGSRTKNGNNSIIPLSDAAFDLIDKHYDKSRKFIFGFMDTGYQGWSKSKVELDEALKGISKHWTFHDFRRAGKTAMEQELDVPDNVSEAILNHSKKGLAKVYNGAQYLKQKREALNKYANHLMAIVS